MNWNSCSCKTSIACAMTLRPQCRYKNLNIYITIIGDMVVYAIPINNKITSPYNFINESANITE